MKDNFAACLAATLSHEGGWADHPSDPGGATMRGITLATYRQYRPGATKADLRAITDAEVRTIYRRGYWDVVRGDDLPPGLDLVAFDAAANSGPSRGAQWLQMALGVAADGVVGPKTLAAAEAADPTWTIPTACDMRMTFLRRLPTWGEFGRGWQIRVDDIEAKALNMAAQTRPEQAVSNWLAAVVAWITGLIRRMK